MMTQEQFDKIKETRSQAHEDDDWIWLVDELIKEVEDLRAQLLKGYTVIPDIKP